MKRGTLVVVFIFLILASGILTSPYFNPRAEYLELANETIDEDLRFDLVDTSLLSAQDELEGTLDPVVVEQTGNKTTAILHAETDSKTNVKTILTIDTANDWVGHRASVNLWNLERLYVKNGSLSQGITGETSDPLGSVSYHPYGWDAISYNGSDASMEMLAGYSNQEISVTAAGYSPLDDYFYVNGSYVYWIQTVNNTPYLENFIFNVDFLYNSRLASSNVTLHALVDDMLIWNITAETLLDGTWYNSGDVLVDLTGIGSQFEFKIGLYFNGAVSYSKKRIGFLIDNIKLVGETSPTFDDADISLNIIGFDSVPITGTSVGQASIPNPSLWSTDNVLIELTADLSYSFDYIATMLNSRYINSTRSPILFDDGVQFLSQLNGNSLLNLYTFLGAISDIDDFTLIIRVPVDWENVTVYNPLGTPVTSSCIINPGSITIPTSILYTLGWWQISLESPNYIRSIQTFKLNEPSLTWFPTTVFRTTNISKPSIEIGGALPLFVAPQNVNISWYMPNGTEWFSESVSGGSYGVINGSQLEFGSSNTTAGVWQVQVAWTNGTEMAFGIVNFEVHHGTSLTPHYSDINIDSDVSVSNFVYYKDLENDEFLMDPVASLTANWSSTTVNFSPILLENRWLASFDTTLIGPGTHLVIVNVSRPFYDDASCTFLITLSFADNVLTINDPTADIGIGDTYLTTFSYKDAYGVGINGANASIEFTGPTGGVTWTELTDLGGGDYSIEFTAVHSGSYAVTISASKDHYDESDAALFIFVGERTTSLSLENGTSAVVGFGEQYRLVVRFTNGSGFGLDGASVSVLSTTPETGINYTTVMNEGNGYFSIILTPSDSKTYTVVINASLQDYVPQHKSFTLTATTIAAQLRVEQGLTSASVGVSLPFELLVFYEQTGSTQSNISLADLEVIFISYETLVPEIINQTEGYLIRFPTDQIGSYKFTITANRAGFQIGSVEFTLFVQERAMRVVMQTPIWFQSELLNITLELVEVDSGGPVTGAVVSFKLYRLLDVELEGYLTETSPGIYSLSIEPEWYRGSAGYEIRIFAEKENFVLDENYYEFQVAQTIIPEVAIMQFLWTVLPPIGGLVILSIVSVLGRVVNQRKKKAEFAIDLVNKRRFDDADNIIGVIVLHKSSGIPVYSRIVKGGFEEGIVAAFISAVTHFREEFEMVEEDEMRVIPISDIIRAVQTRNLICAFVTVRSASLVHNRKMESFGMAAGTYLDDFYTADIPPSAIDSRIAEILDYVYDETMDGKLIKFHKIETSDKLPKRYRSIEQVLSDMESTHCSKPLFLTKAVSKYGISSARGCTLVSEVIEKRLIIPCEEHEFPESDFDFSKFFNKQDGDSEE